MPTFTIVAVSDLLEGVGCGQYSTATAQLAMAQWVDEMLEPEIEALGFPSRKHLDRALRRETQSVAVSELIGVSVASLSYKRKNYLYLVAVETQTRKSRKGVDAPA